MLQVGERIGERYTVVEKLGQGGMASVYEVRSDALGNRLAVKLVAPELMSRPTVLQRFRQEAKLQATVTHPGVCRVFDLIEYDGRLAIVMELVDAPTLRAEMDASRMQPHHIRSFIRELLSSLAACHTRGIVHRDLKPENLFVLRDHAGDVRCKLADFGVAKDLARADDDNLTRTRSFVGTYMYASPEQVASSATVDARSDLYSVGVIAWEVLAGVPPYADLDSAYSIQVAVVNEPLPALPPTVPSDLRRLVAELTRKEPDERPHTALEALEILGDAGLDVATAMDEPAHEQQLEPPSSSDRVVTVWDPTPEEAEVSAPAARRARQAELQLARETRLARLSTPSIPARLWAHGLDEFLFQLTVLSCVGIVVYPFLAVLRGAFKGRSLGHKSIGAGVYVARTGRPAGFWRMVVRNTVDMLLIGGGLALTLWPLGWTVGAPVLGVPWFLCAVLIEVVVMATHPDGRRIADLIAGTRVSVRA